MSAIKGTVEARQRGNMTKMDMALWDRDAARGGVDHANRLAEYAYERIQEVRQAAIGRETLKEQFQRQIREAKERPQERDTGRGR